MTSTSPIVFVINALRHGGAERLVISEINECLQRGLDVRLITLGPERSRDSLRSSCHLAEDMHRTIIFSSLFSWRAWIDLLGCLRAWKPQAVITHLWFSNTIARVAAWLVGTPRIIAFEHNVYGRRKRFSHYLIDRLLARISTAVIAVSEAVRASLIERGIPQAKVQVLLNAINTRAYASLLEKSGAWAQLDIPPTACVYISVARLIFQKGFDILIPIFATLPDAVLLIVGDGEERGRLTQLIKEHQLEQRVKLLGTRNDIPELLASADIFVLPSRWEGLPMVILEAMAAGLPIVATAVQGTSEVLTDGKNALLVPPEQPAALEAALRRLSLDPGLRAELGAAALKSSRLYAIEAHVDRLFQLATASEGRT